jgi:predicted adenylyl cyclase CyaB
MRNIELKYRCEDLVAVRKSAEKLKARDLGHLLQTDTFFEAPHARLKLRNFGDGRAELIGYRRSDRPEARASDYFILPIENPAEFEAILEYALGISGVVKKSRHLFLVRHTRLHLDEVENLGSFVELETVISDQSEADAHAELHQVAAELGLRPENAVAQPYVDLLRRAAISR